METTDFKGVAGQVLGKELCPEAAERLSAGLKNEVPHQPKVHVLEQVCLWLVTVTSTGRGVRVAVLRLVPLTRRSGEKGRERAHTAGRPSWAGHR